MTKDSDEFILVTSKNKRGLKLNSNQKPLETDKHPRDECFDQRKIKEYVQKAIHEFEHSTFQSLIVSQLHEITLPIHDIVAYGLGSLAESRISRYQLALLLAFKSHFNADVFAYDPQFHPIDKTILNDYNCRLINENECGKRAVTHPSLFYLPHCAKQLVNNVLWANWSFDKLTNCCLISNSFASVVRDNYDRDLKKNAGFILKISEFVREIPLVNCFEQTDVFNDLSIHVFPAERLREVDEEFWKRDCEITYGNEDSELISSSNV